ncbi:MAG: glycosyltransferase involved in cell wall biosynthesis [Lentimonas sp.]|jgi:glycosyltransferase involved in cell wall biosynthesis
MSSQLSAVIITFNEEHNIERCITALEQVADEIIVLDSFSTDRTEEICKSKGVVFHLRKWDGYAASKNHLNQLASHKYVFSVDADEVINEELKKAILKEKETGFKGIYRTNRRTNYLGSWINHSGWFPDWKERIFPKDEAKWEGEFVHETLSFSAEIKPVDLPGHLEHYSYTSFEDHRQRADKYSSLTAQKMHAQGKKASFLKPLLSAAMRFVSMYLIKSGFLDGKMGFHIARISAASNYFKYSELRRLNKSNE